MTTAQETPSGPTSPPPCPAEISQYEHSSKDQTNNFTHTRCQFTYSDGRQCRNPAKVYPQDELSPVRDQKVPNERAYLCVHHASKRDPGLGAEGAPVAALVGLCSDLTNATNINRALSHVFLLMAQGRISQKQAVAFGYITQLLLQTLPGVRSEFVSVYDPNAWRARLRASFEQAEENDGDNPGSEDDHGRHDNNIERPNAEIVARQQGVLPRERPLAANVYQQDELRGKERNQELSRVIKSTPFLAQKESILSESDHPIRMVIPNEHRERGTPPPISRENPTAAVNRSPLTEQESPKSSESKQERARVAEVITLVPRSSPLQELPPTPAESVAPPSPPAAPKRLARDFYGNPIPRADWWCSLPGAAAAMPQRSSPPNEKSGQPAVILSESANADERRIAPKSEKLNSARSSSPASSRPPSNPHTTEWFAPASWSARQKPDPYPTGAGKLRNKFRSMANSALRRMHHQNSRGFWSPGAKQLAT